MSINIYTRKASEEDPQDSLRKLNNFCSTYSRQELDELQCRSLGALLGGNYLNLRIHERERLMDYFEALEEVLGELHAIRSRLLSGK